MPSRPPSHRGAGARSETERNNDHDKRRGSARQRGYSARWERARKAYLTTHPLCIMCERKGRITPSAVVDHIVAHGGDQSLFWNQSNWQPLCKPHHDGDKQRQERRTEREDVTKLFPFPAQAEGTDKLLEAGER